MNINKFKLSFMILLLECIFAKRISELKCDETASLNTDPRSLHPHLMEIFKIDSKLVRSYSLCPATLISEDFVLTSTNCIDRFTFSSLTNLKIRKSKLPEEQYSDFSLNFGIKKIMRHELTNQPYLGMNAIALIQLNETVPYRNNGSIFRPACLWTGTIDPSDLYSRYGFNSNKLNIGSFIVSSEQYIKAMGGASENFSNSMSQSYFNTTNDFDINLGSPVEVNVRNQIFIFGIISFGSFRDASVIYIAPKISSFIAWIETKVWPQLTNLECGQRKVKHKPLMTFAQPSYHGEFPWHIAMFKNNRIFICGGTILSSRTILTAAHCVQDERGIILSPGRLTIVAGTHNLNEYPIEAQTFSVETITVLENYSRTFLENDIALLKLYSVIVFSQYVQPICISNMLDYKNFPIGSVAGWGTDESNQLSDVLLQATFLVRDNFECRHSNRDFFAPYLNDHNYCAGYQNGTSVCSGDSGGGMVIEFESRWFIRGIVSLGVAVPNTGRCDTTEMVLFTDVPKFYGWIKEQLEDN